MVTICEIEVELFGNGDLAYGVGDSLPITTYANAYPENFYVFGKVGDLYRVVLVEGGNVVTYSDLTLNDESVYLKYMSISVTGDTYVFGTSSSLLEWMHFEDVTDTYFSNGFGPSRTEAFLSEKMDDEKRLMIDLVLHRGMHELGERYMDLFMVDSNYRNGLIGDVLDVVSKFNELDQDDEGYADAEKGFLLSMKALKNAFEHHGSGDVVDKFGEDVDAYVSWDATANNRFTDREDVLATLKEKLDTAFNRLSSDKVAKSIEIEIKNLF